MIFSVVDKMSALTYIQATIQFLPKGGVSSRQYSDRCLIELLTSTAGEFSLRAIDLDNKKEVSVNFDLKTMKYALSYREYSISL